MNSDPIDLGHPLTIETLVAEAHGNSVRKGWWEGVEELTVADVEEKIALIHSEISEALEDFRDGKMVTTIETSGKPIGFPTELADVVIRIGDLVGKLGLSLLDGIIMVSGGRETSIIELTEAQVSIEDRQRRVPSWLGRMHAQASDAFDHALDPDLDSLVDCLAECVAEACLLAHVLNINLDAEIRCKMAFNRTRPHRHGGKAC